MATHTGSASIFDPAADVISLRSGARGAHASAEIDSRRTGSAGVLPLELLGLPVGPFALVRRSQGDPGYGGMPLVTVFGSVVKTVGLEWLSYQPGDYYMDDFCCANPTTGNQQNADSLPTVTVWRMNGVTGAFGVSTDMPVTVVAIDTGGYVCYGTLPTTWQRGDTIVCNASLIIAGKTQEIPVSTFVIGGIPALGLAWPARPLPCALYPGGYYLDQFCVIRPDTAIASDADSAPALTIYRRNGVTGAMGFDVSMTLALAHAATGWYVPSGTIPPAWNRKDVIVIRAAVVVGGKAQKIPISTFVLGGQPLAGINWP